MSFKYQKYQELKTLVELLLSDVHQAHVYDPTWKSLLGEISGFFAREIAVFTDLGSRQQSYQTEISKQIRLLEVDNSVVLPVGVYVRVNVTAADVLHS